MNHLHLPAQSGNDRILQEMRRGNTVAEYLALTDALKTAVPDIEISSDIIVGYPGETENEFEDTLRFMERVGFSSSFMFCYSPRPNTPAADLVDDVPESTKKERLQRIIECQSELGLAQGEKFLGKEVEVLIEGQSTRKKGVFKGRNPQFWQVNFTGDETVLKPGDLVNVKVEEVSGHALKGHAVV
jgi:tRNA-2-methylthio-N6-dimethylallyladenosine synthase